MKLHRTTPAHPHYRELVDALDEELTITDGEDHDFYDQFNGSEDIHHVLLLEEPAGVYLACGALKQFDDRTMEIKRMYTVEAARGRGLAGRVLRELERWATELGYGRLILETGTRQTAALRLYTKHGYRRMAENYAQYAGVANSVCFEKVLTAQ
jgi:GNAT superfamily N-acetyltransferase